MVSDATDQVAHMPTRSRRAASEAHPARRRPMGKVWAGRAITALAVLFLLFDGGIKLLQLPVAMDATVQIGYPRGSVFTIGLLLFACLVVYLIPRTAIVGAVLLTGYLGGAVATQFRVGNPLVTHVLFPTYIAALLWGGLYLRDSRVRAMLSAR